MAYGKAVTANPIRNNGGVVPRGGNVPAGSPITNTSNNLVQGYTSKGVGGTAPILNVDATIAKAGSVFAGHYKGKYIMMRYGHVNGVSSRFLNSGAADFGRRSINYKENRRTFHVTSWSYTTGAATYGSPTDDNFGQDHAARPTRAIPGELTYTSHGMAKSGPLAVPANDDYKPKTQ